MRTIAVCNHKGGSGKTTTSVNLAAALAAAGRKVLVIDLDPQCSASAWLGVSEEGRGLYDVFSGDGQLVDLIRPTEVRGLAAVPGSAWLAAADKALAGEVGAEAILRGKLEAMQKRLRSRAANWRDEPDVVTLGDYLKYGQKDPEKAWRAKIAEASIEEGKRLTEERRQERTERVQSTVYDFAFLDCPPSLGVLLINALCAAGEVLVPVEAHFLAAVGLAQLFRTVELVQQRLNPKLSVTGILPCRVKKTRHADSVLEGLRGQFEGVVFDTVIRENVRLAECAERGRPINLFDPRSAGCRDYRELAEELVRRGEQK